MNYLKIYQSLIERARQRSIDVYTELHHIIPRCMGGSDEPDNLVRLTPEEHYVAHQLLVRIYPGNPKLVYAATAMTFSRDGSRSNNKLFGWIRRKMAAAASERERGKVHSRETVAKRAASNRGKRRSEETKRRISEKAIGRVISDEQRKIISQSNKERDVSTETRQRMSHAHKGRVKSQSEIDSIRRAHNSADVRSRKSKSMASKIWITDGSANRRIDKSEPIPAGWKQGRSTSSRNEL